MKKIILVVIVHLCVSTSFAAKPPKPVDELEARVATLEAEVAALAAAPRPVQVLANGESIGLFVGDAEVFLYTNACCRTVFVLSDKDFVFAVDTDATPPPPPLSNGLVTIPPRRKCGTCIF